MYIEQVRIVKIIALARVMDKSPKCKNEFAEPRWWVGVQILTKLIHNGEVQITDESSMIELLKDVELSDEEIQKVFNWIEMAQNSDCFFEVYNMLDQPSEFSRIPNQLESLSIPSEVFNKIQEYRRSGFLSDEHCERIIEGLRSSDTRDWDEEDINSFYEDIIHSVVSDDCRRMIISSSKIGTDETKKMYH